MADELLTDGAEAPVADDLRSTITAALEQQRIGNTEAPPEKPQEAAPTDAEKAQRARDEQGRFAAQEKAQEAKEEKPAAQQAQPEKAAPEAPQAEQVVRPPPGWSPKSKASFDSLPPEVKADIAKRETEVNQGLAKLADYRGVERFAEQARQSGTTLEGALTNYTQWESSLKKDPVASVMHLAGNLGINPQQLAQAILQRAGGAPAQPQAGADPNMAQIHPALLQEIAQMKGTLAAQEAQRAQQDRQYVAQNVNAFWDDPKNKYAENVSPIMVNLINQDKANGKTRTLSEIYEDACWLHPEVRKVLINERQSPQLASDATKATAARAAAAAKAVTGAPARGASPGNAPPQNESTRDTIRRALAEQRSNL